MKYFMIFAVIFAVVACLTIQSSASPGGALHGRYKRATCDLLSGAGIGHSACAVSCIFRGNEGGYCNSEAACVCRNKEDTENAAGAEGAEE